MQSSPRGKQYGRRGKRSPGIETTITPTEVTLSDAERKRRLFNRDW